jgi:hypothetical protein
MWLMSLTKRNATHQEPITMTLWIPRTTSLPKFPIHGCSLTRPRSTFKNLTKQTMTRYIENPLSRFWDLSIDHHTLVMNFLNKNNMNKLCLLKCKGQRRCPRLEYQSLHCQKKHTTNSSQLHLISFIFFADFLTFSPLSPQVTPPFIH